MKFISWNVNGLRAVLKKDFLTTFKSLDADFFSIQETKMQAGQAELLTPGYYQYFNYAQRKGYSGTAIFTKHKPDQVTYGMGIPEFDDEGRIITLEYPNFYLLNCYTPNSGSELKRLEYRQKWNAAFLNYTKTLAAQKPLIFCGDLNVAHENIDLKNWKTNHHNAGFTDEERQGMTDQLAAGFTDTFRYFYPELEGVYSWWSYRFSARKNNSGWRIDYFITSNDLQPKIKDSKILTQVFDSDHCPVELETVDLLTDDQ